MRIHAPTATAESRVTLSVRAAEMPAMTNSQRDIALLFHSLHTNDPVLVLPNAWDAVSARIAEAAGASAVATTSAGAVGVNLEDGRYDGLAPLRETADQAERIAAARNAADQERIPLFINARIDTYLRAVGDTDSRLRDTLARAAAYVAAGASGIFVPGVGDPAIISALVNGIDAPLNVLVGPGSPPVSELGALGVARVSAGSSIAAAAYSLGQRAVEELLGSGTYTSVEGARSHGELNGL